MSDQVIKARSTLDELVQEARGLMVLFSVFFAGAVALAWMYVELSIRFIVTDFALAETGRNLNRTSARMNEMYNLTTPIEMLPEHQPHFGMLIVDVVVATLLTLGALAYAIGIVRAIRRIPKN